MNDETYQFKEEEQNNQPHHKSNNGLVVGGVLIAVGVLLVVTRLMGWAFDNWWVLFLLIPAFSSFGQAGKAYQRDGRLGPDGTSSLIGGLTILFIASMFFFGISWTMLWPVLLIIVGIGSIAKAYA